jgi:signal transduction histidine kinase
MATGSIETRCLIEVARAVERERRRIARGLHDQVGQQLYEAVRELDRVSPEPDVERAQSLIRTALESTRSLTFDLGLPPVEDSGLAGILETLCRSTGASHEIDVFFEEHGEAGELSEGVVLVLSQIVRELLFNVVKHARARTSSVVLSHYPDRLRIIVTDDGVGLTGQLNDAGFGLADSNSRLRRMGGRFEFGSKDGLGTQIVLELPLGAASAS